MAKCVYQCPVGTTISIIGGKWKPMILWQIKDGPRRFTYLKNRVEGITQKMLTQQLRELEADDLIARQVFNEMPLRVEYSLTLRGKTLFPILEAMANWGYEQQPSANNVPLSKLDARNSS